LKTSLRSAEDLIVGKQDESILILKENTTALAAIKSQVEDLTASNQETREKLDTLEATLVSSKAPKSEEVIKSADAAATGKQANDSQPTSQIVAAPVAARPSAPLKLRWNVEGNWNPTAAETAEHLRSDHGVQVNGLTHQEMHDLHADLHEGKRTSAVAVKSKSVQIINRGSSCPGGVCPTSSRPVRRGLFGRRR